MDRGRRSGQDRRDHRSSKGPNHEGTWRVPADRADHALRHDQPAECEIHARCGRRTGWSGWHARSRACRRAVAGVRRIRRAGPRAARCGLLEAPGFIRWIWFSDGPHGYALGLWRSPEDAVAFARGALHQELVREQREQGNEYSQFAGIWAAHTVGRRNYYCPDCGAITNAPATVCSGCGEALDDGFTAG
jgi:hypothetical protein